ncbi:DUF423 domain-containing protein [Abyssalbus ytuae]|uniref:DUF423 domain-containing protein n=1 Tax=Abyssalbus ytuae TaxID=2926907 RepID=A0A9E6ZS63_9FLAO|nr:DUF423 domain-containing protein [Abyssalbus ytuae]UOB19490.1 DUF423 domain-containing protein [Abyssalbus ytuae]
MNKYILVAGAFFGLTAVVLGAFGAHVLKDSIGAENLKTFETGVKYQMYHALLLLLLGCTSFVSQGTKQLLLYLIVAGIVFFSGSVYGLATNSLTSFDFKKIALITPVGGLLLIISWGILLYNFIKIKIE